MNLREAAPGAAEWPLTLVYSVISGYTACGDEKMQDWYYSHMSKPMQAAYHDFLTGLTGLTALSPRFPVTRLSGEELQRVFFLLRLDHPELFWAVSFRYSYYEDASHVLAEPEYLMDKNKLREHQKAMQSRSEKLLRPARSLSPWEQEQYIHDFICENITYDKLKKPYSHEIIGALGQGVAVCEGIAKSVKLLCDGLGLPCIIALSDANPEKGIKYRHVWNVVELGGRWYHLDATFDNSLTRADPESGIRYDYFNLDDARFFRDHEPLIAPAPACTDGDGFWYRQKKLSFTKPEDVQNRAKQAAKKGKVLTFHWRGGYLTRETLQELLALLNAVGEEAGKPARIALNWPQAVLRVRFDRDAAVTMENPAADAED